MFVFHALSIWSLILSLNIPILLEFLISWGRAFHRIVPEYVKDFLYISVLVITISGALKKLYNGEELDMFFFNLGIKDNFKLAEIFYEIHIIGNYTLIALIILHISAVIIHKLLFKENLLKRIL